MRAHDPFHEGELRAQALAGEADEAGHNGRMISDELAPGMLPFVAQQPFVVVARRDDDGRPWADLLVGAPGLLRASRRAVWLDLSRAAHQPDDPLLARLRAGGEVGLLLLEPATRRRLRINGVLSAEDGATLRVDVREAFPNCPKFIQKRALGETTEVDTPAPASLAERLAEADTLFVASSHAQRGLDASHRGGPPGFAALQPDGSILVPDYAGNSMFNTLGNLLVDPRCALLVVDFRRARALALTGRAAIEWSGDDPSGRTGGTGRWWRFTPEATREVELPPTFRWDAPEAWPRHPPGP